MSERPIADYALLSDCQGAALTDRTGSIDWLCLPRFDAAAQLGRLLDREAGHWSLRPTGSYGVERRYLDKSLVLETTFLLDDARLVLTDALAVGPNESGHELGMRSLHTVLRELRCEGGDVEVELEYAPRPEYGLSAPLLRLRDGGVLGRGGASVLLLSSGVPVAVEGSTARARFRMRPGERRGFSLEVRGSAEPSPEVWSEEAIARQLEDTLRAWRSWSSLHQGYEGPWRDLVHHSGCVLQGLTYAPTGAIVAAPTTSLPERAGGARNWDYRYTWVRDASLTLDALWVAACPDEAHRFFDFIADAGTTRLQGGDDLQIMFGVGGEHDLSERELWHLSGWRGSAPVRVGNSAWSQRQIDVYGELVAAAERLRDHLEHVDDETRGFLREAAEVAARRWREPDQGIWEVRTEPRHFLYSKLMCWVALDRATALADVLGWQERVNRWMGVRDEIRTTILERGWSDRLGSFTQAFGDDELDASLLVMPIVGFLPADDPRMLATIDAIEEHLTDEHGLVYRYLSDDGMEGPEGTFLLCTFWLAEARARAGQIDRAIRVFERAAAYTNDVGLLSEEVDPLTGELLGNFPQAYSHIGLVNAAWAIHEASRRG